MNKHRGSNFDDFLKEEGIFEEVEAAAIKAIIAEEIVEAMRKQRLTKKAMTERMRMKSRTQLDRLLDPKNHSVTLLTLEKAASALGKRLSIRFIKI